jgi:signal-transduction protein with cAMP-binding, CBS, and nucleotidyltransferase domain
MSERLRETFIPPGATIRDAMQSLHRSGAQIALVVDDEDRLQGALTDGDVRRALLAGASLDSAASKHMQTHVLTMDDLADRPKVLELMRARKISQVPIIDHESRVIGLHLLHEMLSVSERPNWAVIGRSPANAAPVDGGGRRRMPLPRPSGALHRRRGDRPVW